MWEQLTASKQKQRGEREREVLERVKCTYIGSVERERERYAPVIGEVLNLNQLRVRLRIQGFG